MNLEQLKTQQVQLLARKSLITDETAQIDKALGQIAAVVQFAEAAAKEAEQATAVESTPSA